MNNDLIMNPFAAMEMVAFFIVLILFITIVTRWKSTEKSSKIFALNLFFILFGICCDVIAISVSSKSLKTEALFTLLAMLFGCTTCPGFAYYCTVQANSKKKVVSYVIPRVILIATTITQLICIVTFLTGQLFRIENNTLTAGFPAYIMFSVEILSTIVMAIVIISLSKKISQLTFTALFLLLVISISGSLAELFFPGVFLSYTAISISALVQFILLQSRLISEAEMREQIEGELSRTDVMTGLQNRRAYTEYIDSLSSKVTAGVGFFDVNGLKRTNDIQGHVAGDKLITSFANLLISTLHFARIYRISGDEFVALYIGKEKKQAFEREIENVKKAIIQMDSIASVGAIYKENEVLQLVITETEKLMYEDKREYYSKNNVDRRKARG